MSAFWFLLGMFAGAIVLAVILTLVQMASWGEKDEERVYDQERESPVTYVGLLYCPECREVNTHKGTCSRSQMRTGYPITGYEIRPSVLDGEPEFRWEEKKDG